MSVPVEQLLLKTRPLNVRPWYREPWPWLLMAGPLAAVVMGVVMVVLATRSNDGLVADDYYKRGLTINQTLDRVERARTLGLAADAAFNPDRTQVRVLVTGVTEQKLVLRLVHPTRAGLDQVVDLSRGAGGLYEGRMSAPALGHWHLSIEDPAATWRISGVWSPEADAARLEPASAR
jgi:uncharacterized protein